MKDINTESFEEINTIENFRGRGGGMRGGRVGRSVSPVRRGDMRNVGRRLDRGRVGNRNFGGLRRERPKYGGRGPRPRHGLPRYRRRVRPYHRRPYFNTNLAFYNPYYNLFPLYDDSGTVIYNSINDECRDKCFKQCKSDDLKCLANYYLDCKDEKENFETTSNTFNRKHLLFLIIVILLFFILMK
jgi:hypothetical protein